MSKFFCGLNSTKSTGVRNATESQDCCLPGVFHESKRSWAGQVHDDRLHSRVRAHQFFLRARTRVSSGDHGAKFAPFPARLAVRERIEASALYPLLC